MYMRLLIMSSHLYDWYDLCFECVHVVCIALLGECNLVTLHVCHLIWHYYGLDGIIHCKNSGGFKPFAGGSLCCQG